MGDRPKSRNGESGIAPVFLESYQVAARLNVSVSTLMRWRRADRIPDAALPVRITPTSRGLSWPSAAVDRWIEEITVSAGGRE